MMAPSWPTHRISQEPARAACRPNMRALPCRAPFFVMYPRMRNPPCKDCKELEPAARSFLRKSVPGALTPPKIGVCVLPWSNRDGDPDVRASAFPVRHAGYLNCEGIISQKVRLGCV